MSDSQFDAMVNRAKELHRDGHFAEARDLLRQALIVGERAFGPDAAELIPALSFLAMAIRENRYSAPPSDEELGANQRVLHIAERAFGPNDVRTAGALHAVGLDLWILKRHDEARICFTRALDIAGRVHDDAHYFVSQVRGGLGSLLAGMWRFDEAIPLLQREAEAADAKAHAASRMVAH